MSPINGRRKGHDFERDIAAALRPIWPEARRGAQSRAGTDAPDVDGTPYWIECKRGRRPSIPAACKQALAATDGRPVVVIVKDDRKPAIVLRQWRNAIRQTRLPVCKLRSVDLSTCAQVVDIAGAAWLALSLGAFIDAHWPKLQLGISFDLETTIADACKRLGVENLTETERKQTIVDAMIANARGGKPK